MAFAATEKSGRLASLKWAAPWGRSGNANTPRIEQIGAETSEIWCKSVGRSDHAPFWKKWLWPRFLKMAVIPLSSYHFACDGTNFRYFSRVSNAYSSCMNLTSNSIFEQLTLKISCSFQSNHPSKHSCLTSPCLQDSFRHHHLIELLPLLPRMTLIRWIGAWILCNGSP